MFPWCIYTFELPYKAALIYVNDARQADSTDEFIFEFLLIWTILSVHLQGISLNCFARWIYFHRCTVFSCMLFKSVINDFIVYWIILLAFCVILIQTSAKVQLFPFVVTLMVWCKVMSQINSPWKIKQDPNRTCSHFVCGWNTANSRHVDNYDEKPLSIYVGKWNSCVFSITVWDIMGYYAWHSHR